MSLLPKMPLSSSMLDDLQQATATVAQKALSTPCFLSRNELHARAIGAETGHLAGISVGEDLQTLFTEAAEAAGALFQPAFTQSGEPIRENENELQRALGGTCVVAYDALRKVAHEVDDIVARARISDVAKFVGNKLGVDVSTNCRVLKEHIEGMKEGELRGDASLICDETGKNTIDRIEVNGTGLTEKEGKVLEVGLRLANATWKAAQIHRAAWEASDKRVDAERKIAYAPFDKMMNVMYRQGVTRVVYEVYKDLEALKEARRKSSA